MILLLLSLFIIPLVLAVGVLLLMQWLNHRRESRYQRPKLSTLEIGQLVTVKGKEEAGQRMVMSRLLTCDAVTLDAPVDGLQVWDSDCLRVVK